jgi:hypothetical protein
MRQEREVREMKRGQRRREGGGEGGRDLGHQMRNPGEWIWKCSHSIFHF